MNKYFIEDAKCGVTKGGMACGPVPGSVVGAVKFCSGKDSMWLYLVETDGFPGFYLSDRELYDELIEEDFDDEFVEYMDNHLLAEMDGICLRTEYEDVIESIYKNRNNSAAALIRFMITLVRCDLDKVDSISQSAIGRYVDEIDIPMSDLEQDYQEELEEE